MTSLTLQKLAHGSAAAHSSAARTPQVMMQAQALLTAKMVHQADTLNQHSQQATALSSFLIQKFFLLNPNSASSTGLMQVLSSLPTTSQLQFPTSSSLMLTATKLLRRLSQALLHQLQKLTQIQQLLQQATLQSLASLL